MSDNIVVVKQDHLGREVWRYPARVLSRADHTIRLEAFFNRDDMPLGYATFKRGDRFIETYYSDRWYNVHAIYDRDDGALKGWYANVGRPAEYAHEAVRYDDLALDLWVSPAGDVVLLDEDEFAALPLTPEEGRAAEAAVVELLALAQSGRLPR